jgi:hypothetical protein
MASPAVCPEAPELQQLLLGKLAPEQTEAYLSHAEHCPTCADAVERLLAADTLATAVRRGSAEDTAPISTPVTELIRRVCDLHQPATSLPVTLPDPVASLEDEMAGVLAPPQAPDEIGRLGGYRVLRKLGSGGMGVVYLAEDVALRRQVALKVMLPTLAQRAAARKRFVTEARAVAAIEHENIVAIHQISEERGIPFLAMPLLKGMTLEERLRGGAVLPVTEVLRLGRQIALGLAEAHDRGLVHRDVKPANIWIEPDGRVKLLDFGLARAQVADRDSGEGEPLTEPGTLIGTPAYMAPEQARGVPVDGRADLFSLGCVLYRMCTGKPAFNGGDVLVVLLAIASEDPPPASTVNPAVPKALSQLIRRLLAKDPAQRPASARVVAQRLAALPGIIAGGPAPRKWTGLQAAVAALLLVVVGTLLAGIVVRIKDSKGNVVATIQVPSGGSIEMVEGVKAKKVWNAEAIYDDPITLTPFSGRRGKFQFRVLGLPGGSVWGSGPYTLDSNLATAVVHSGKLKVGQVGVVEVEIVESPLSFAESTANGITTNSWIGAWTPGAFLIRKASPAAEQGPLPDPRMLRAFAGQFGTRLSFRVTGGRGGSVWGSGPYTLDSYLPTAAVHAGVLKVGQTGVIDVEVVESPQSFAGSTANGVTSDPWRGVWTMGAFLIKGGRVEQGQGPLPNPGNLSNYSGQFGAKVMFRVTGDLVGAVWGSGPYTIDSSLAAAAVHAGVLKVGQTGDIEVQIIMSPQGFVGSTANGVTTMPWLTPYLQGAFLIKGGRVGIGQENNPRDALADPGHLLAYAGMAGARATIRVTGEVGGSVWGSGPYTLDSSLAAAAVHAGVLKAGETGDIQVEILASPRQFSASSANGVTTQPYGSYPPGAFQFLK